MTEDYAADREEPVASLLAAFDDPAAGRRRLPRLVGLLDDEDETVRIGAAWTTCHVAAKLPDTAAYLTRRLTDRLADETPALEAALVFEFVAARYPDAVAAELDAIESETDERRRAPAIEGNLARANYHLPEIGKRDVGRTRLPGEGGSTGPLHRSGVGPGRGGNGGTGVVESDEGTDDADGTESAGGDADGTDEGDESDESRDDGGEEGATGDAEWNPADELPVIVSESAFDRLSILGKRGRSRYADVYRTLGVVGGDELPVALAFFHLPDADRTAFAGELADELARWAGVSDHENVLTLYDWGVEPRPWAAVEYTDRRLSDRGRLPFEAALADARDLASAVEHVHDNGVVHGGVDPGNVVYYGNVLDEGERQPPLLTDVGVLHAVRRHFDPRTRLDPRYAAPEYFDRRFGRIDHATDVYGTGAVLYRLFTGRPPYDGEYGRVRECVLNDPPPRPGDVADVPAGVDDVVTKAMARQKLRRYESVAHLRQELRGLSPGGDDD